MTEIDTDKLRALDEWLQERIPEEDEFQQFGPVNIFRDCQDAILAMAEERERMREALAMSKRQVSELSEQIKEMNAERSEKAVKIERFARSVEAGDFANVSASLNDRMCCNGIECGCLGSTVGEYLAHELRSALGRDKA